MHNNIMAAGSRDRPPMLATGRYAQWRSRFLRYIDTRPNGDALRKCILKGPYTPTIVTTPAVPATKNSPAVPEQTTVKICREAIERLQQGFIIFKISWTNQQHKLDEVSYHKLFDILKQYQKEVNELRAERMAKNANPLALVATAQTLQDTYYQSSKSHKSYAPTSKASLPTRSHATTRYKGKEIAKPITPPSESASEEDSDPEQAQRDKDMQKNLALIAKYFKKIYKPTNNNLRTSSNTRNKNVDTTPRYKNDNQTGQFRNQRAVNVAGARETVGGQVKDSTYHKEKMLLCKQAEKRVNFKRHKSGLGSRKWMKEIDEQDETVDSNVILTQRICVISDIQSMTKMIVECDDEIQELKRANATLTQELTECKSILAKTSRTLRESNSIWDSCLVLLQNKQNEFERYKAFNDRTVDYDKLERKLNETLGLLAQKEIDIKEGLKVKAYEISVLKRSTRTLVQTESFNKVTLRRSCQRENKGHNRFEA
ncbi:hypothetical protein Tco_1029403 [Tanacetum coccineum]|uniref:Uncharacterized protein n=1 Tax=Tanacetum coccineum TaxID=301880 RepID=A0ABQ5G5K5_9ASTR